MKKRVMVLGVGNLLLKDEGIGVHVITEMKKKKVPSHVEVVDGGTAGLDLIYMFSDVDKLIVIDAVDAGVAPGAIFKFSPEDVKERAGKERTSLHQISLLEALKVAKATGRCPETMIIGVQPEQVDWDEELSTTLRKKIPQIIAKVEEEM